MHTCTGEERWGGGCRELGACGVVGGATTRPMYVWRLHTLWRKPVGARIVAWRAGSIIIIYHYQVPVLKLKKVLCKLGSYYFRFINDFHRSIHPCTDTKGQLVWCGGEQLRPRDG